MMKKMGSKGLRWLKIVHFFFISMWVGGGISLVLLLFCGSPANGDELYALYASMKLIDDFIIIPGALGNFLTGLIYGTWSNWGFFKHRWLTVKWILTVVQILFGTFWLGPWLNGNTAIAKAERILALQNPVFLHNQSMNAIWGTLQVALLLVMVGISVLKPWKK